MIIGAHSILFSKNPEADRTFFRHVLKFPYVDAGEGWLIFRLPRGELAVHPAEESEEQELFLMCDDARQFIEQMKKQKIDCKPIEERAYGLVTQITLPSGGRLGVYEPRHSLPSVNKRMSNQAVRKTKKR